MEVNSHPSATTIAAPFYDNHDLFSTLQHFDGIRHSFPTTIRSNKGLRIPPALGIRNASEETHDRIRTSSLISINALRQCPPYQPFILGLIRGLQSWPRSSCPLVAYLWHWGTLPSLIKSWYQGLNLIASAIRVRMIYWTLLENPSGLFLL